MVDKGKGNAHIFARAGGHIARKKYKVARAFPLVITQPIDYRTGLRDRGNGDCVAPLRCGSPRDQLTTTV